MINEEKTGSTLNSYANAAGYRLDVNLWFSSSAFAGTSRSTHTKLLKRLPNRSNFICKGDRKIQAIRDNRPEAISRYR